MKNGPRDFQAVMADLNGSVWFCGIEWGTGKEHDLEIELRGSVSEPPQNYESAEVNLQYPYNIKLMKLIAAMQGGSVANYRRVAYQTHFPFHRDSDFFKLNLFPVAFRKVDRRLWIDKYESTTGLSTREAVS